MRPRMSERSASTIRRSASIGRREPRRVDPFGQGPRGAAARPARAGRSEVARSSKCLVTGGAGFIGSAVVRLLGRQGRRGRQRRQADLFGQPRIAARGRRRRPTIASTRPISAIPRQSRTILASERPDAVMHLAAESHVDRSIDGPAAFVETNVVGTFRLLNAALDYWRGLDGDARDALPLPSCLDRRGVRSPAARQRRVHRGHALMRRPRLIRRPRRRPIISSAPGTATYGLPVVLSNCSNNYGPFHFPEKLIPLIILNALEGKPLPVYGRGENVRDWLHVEDHARALELILTSGTRRRELQCRRPRRAQQSGGGRDDLRHPRPTPAHCRAAEGAVI